MKFKRLLSIVLTASILLSIVLLSVPTAGAASVKSPKMNVIRGQNGFNVVWNKVNNIKFYRLYLGVNGKWRCYTEINVTQDTQSGKLTTHPVYTQSFQLFIDWNALHRRKWVAYGQEAGVYTSTITAPNAYCCQIEAVNGRKEHVAWSNVDYALYGTPTLSYCISGNDIQLSWNTLGGANSYQIAHKSKSSKTYDYTFINSKSTSSYLFKGYRNSSERHYFQIRPCVTYKNAVYEYGAWSTTATVEPPLTYPLPNYGDCVGSLTASSIGLNDVKIILGVDQSTIDNNEIGMYYGSAYLFDDSGVTLFGHNNRSMGKIKNLRNGDIISIKDYIHNKTLKYKVYYVGECKRSSDMKYMTDIYTGEVIDPFDYRASTDLIMATCHDNLWNTNYCAKAKLL